MRVFLIGFMGSGKSHWGRLLSSHTSWSYLDLDTLIEKEAGMSIPAIFSEKGEEHFRLLERDLLSDTIEKHPNLILSCGGGTPCFYNNIDLMKSKGKVLWLNTALPVLVERLKKEKQTRPLIKEVSDEELTHFIFKKMNDRRIYYEQAHLTIREDEADLNTLLQAINQPL